MTDIRPYREEDRAAIESMAAEVVRDGTRFVYRSVPPVMDYWFSPGARVFVAELDGRAVGTYALKPNQLDRGSHVANAGYMVAEAARGRGIGRALGHHSIDEARRRGFASMQFNMVVATNASALRLWEELGFRVVGTLPEVFRTDAGACVDAHVMFRTLA